MTSRALALSVLIAALAGPGLVAAQDADSAPMVTAPLVASVVGASPDTTPHVDGVISTASGVTAPPMTTDQKIANILSAARHADESDERIEQAGPRQVHGTASVSVGTGGYRAASVSALIPVGENGMVGVAYAQSQGGRGFGYGPGPGFGYGQGPGARAGTSQALGLSFAFDGRKDERACRDPREQIEPQWANERALPVCRTRDD